MDSPNGISANLSPDPGGKPSEARLTPYVEIGGVNQLSPTFRSNVNAPSGLDNSPFTPVKRLTIAIAPISKKSGTEYPNSGHGKWMINLDSEQLYTMADQRIGVTKGPGYAFGKDFTEPTPDTSVPCYEAYGTGDGAYSSPIPVQGLPIEFRKVYFRGVEVDEFGCTSGSGASGATYYAYMPCSLPVKQTCASGTGASGYVCNPRNENFGIMSGEVVDWSGFDIGVGGGSAGCSTSISQITGSSGFCSGSGFIAQGCDQVLEFRLDGCLTGSGRLEGGPVQFSGCVTPSGSTGIVTYTLNPNLYSAVSGSGDSMCFASGCNSTLAFKTSGCLTGSGVASEDSQFKTIIECDSGANASIVTFVANPDLYQKISGADTVCTPSGCNSTLAFELSGCLTGNNRFSHDVDCEGNITTVTFSANPDIYSVVSGEDSSVTASGCDSVLSFEASGCNPDFGVSVLDRGGGNAHVVFSLTGEACSGSGIGGSGITGVESIGGGVSIVSGVEDDVAYLNSISGGDNIEVTLVDNTVIISGAGGGGCASGYSNITVEGTTYPAEDCESIVEFEATGCLGLSADTISNGVKVSFGLEKDQVLNCLGYFEKDIEICEGGVAATYTFLVKSS